MTDCRSTFSARRRGAHAERRPVVALESTLITHGFAPPLNLEAARRAEAAVRDGGAEPATVAVHDGRLLVGLSDDAARASLPRATAPRKASRATLALALAEGGWAGTTVSATMIAAALAGIRVFATGGIGGVHRGGAATMDISADLDELARTPVLVVCAGPKSVLDVDLTLEYLETRGVPIARLAARASWPASTRARAAGLWPARWPTLPRRPRVAPTHWELGLDSGPASSRCRCPPRPRCRGTRPTPRSPRPSPTRRPPGIHGPAATPFVLARVAELTNGRSVAANLALIENNARVAAQIATAARVRRLVAASRCAVPSRVDDLEVGAVRAGAGRAGRRRPSRRAARR